MTKLVPAILTNDVADFRLKYSMLLALGQYFDRLHIDFIDGEFLPNKTILPDDLDFFSSPFTLSAHLMTYNPSKYFLKLKERGFEWVVIQYEAFSNDNEILDCIEQAKSLDLRPGLAFNPETPIYKVSKLLPKVDLIQVMGVHPGAQGREFDPGTLGKISELKKLTLHAIISVDGGIRLGLASKCVSAGADFIVIGSAILHATHPKESLEAFKREIELM